MTSGEITETAEPLPNRGLMTVSIMLATTMTTLDVTIANVALPRMAGFLHQWLADGLISRCLPD